MIFSYLTAWRSPQLVMAAQQETTRQWWDDERHHFDLFVSEAVIEEAAAGDPEAAKRRLDAIQGIPTADIQRSSRSCKIPDRARTIAAEGKPRCPSHRNSHSERDGLLAHMELPPHRQCNTPKINETHM